MKDSVKFGVAIAMILLGVKVGQDVARKYILTPAAAAPAA